MRRIRSREAAGGWARPLRPSLALLLSGFALTAGSVGAQEGVVPPFPDAVPDVLNERDREGPALYYTNAPVEDVVAFYRGRLDDVTVEERGRRVLLVPGADRRDTVRIETEPGFADGAVRRAMAHLRASLGEPSTRTLAPGEPAAEDRLRELEERYRELEDLYFPHVEDDEGTVRSTAAVLYRERAEEAGRALVDHRVLQEALDGRPPSADEDDPEPVRRLLAGMARREEEAPAGEPWASYLQEVGELGFTTRILIPRR